jgi:ATP-binding cassette subfamily B protein
MRFWDPDQGSVTIDGVDLRDMRLASLRGMMGIVFQDTFVFDTTLRENIAIGRPDATDEEVLAAAKAAQLDSYIASLPEGINTELGERGVRMSGGQRQRLAIARVILRNPRLLILDEATSALDSQTERDILDTFLDLTHGRTTISITHRLTLAAAADWIVVINKGSVAEQGTHEELLRLGGLYHALYQEQYGKPTGRLLRSEEATMLRTIPLFSTLSDAGLATLVSNVVTEYYPADSVIVRQDDPGDKLYFTKQGQVEVTVRYGEVKHLVTQLGPNDYFGEMTLLSMHRRTATVRALTPTEVYTLTHADFLTILGQNGELRETIASGLTHRQDELEGLLVAQSVS